MKMKINKTKWTALLLATVLITSILTGCTTAAANSIAAITTAVSTSTTSVTTAGKTTTASNTASTITSTAQTAAVTVEYTDKDLDASFSITDSTRIKLNGDSISVTGAGATVTGSQVTITVPGTYIISGTLNNGQIIVTAQSSDDVKLVLDGASITNTTGPAIQVNEADKVILVLVDGTQNKVTDGSQYSNVDASTNEPNAAIYSKSDLVINGNGTLTVDANFSHGINSKDDLKIISGTMTITSTDDTIHSNRNIQINGGNLILSSGDDGIHADTSIVINGGNINIKKSYEGIESANIDVNGGTIQLVSSDDGFNVAGGADGSSVNGRTGQNSFATLANSSLDINGGYIIVNAGGDGLDSNGSMTMTAGSILVNGPTNNGNGAIDYNGTFNLTGGLLIAAGSAGMAEAPGTTSTQNSLLINFNASLTAGTLVNITSSTGEAIVTFAPTKNFQSIVISSPSLKKGSTYTVSTGGSSTGQAANGLYTGGTYSGGTKVATLIISGAVTTYGSAGQTGGPGVRG